LGEIRLGEMGLGEMGLGEMGQNRALWLNDTSYSRLRIYSKKCLNKGREIALLGARFYNF